MTDRADFGRGPMGRLDATPSWLSLGLGGLIGCGLAWGALALGPAAAVLLALGLSGLALGLGARVRLVGEPRRRAPAPPPRLPDLPPLAAVPTPGSPASVQVTDPPRVPVPASARTC